MSPLVWLVLGVFGVGFLASLFLVCSGIIAWQLWPRDQPPPLANVEPRDERPRPIDKPIDEPPPLPNNPIVDDPPVGPLQPPIPPPKDARPIEPTIAVPQILKPSDVKPLPELAIAPIQPAPLKGNREERMLPSMVADACFGGGGRFYILHLPKERQLAIFDVNEARFVRYLPVAEENIRFAAGIDRLYVVAVEKNVIQRYSLATFEREATGTFYVNGEVKAIATGAAARGPILVYCKRPAGSPVAFIDPLTFGEVSYELKGEIDGEHFRASPDGTVFGAWPTSHTQSMTSIVLRGNTVQKYGGEMAGSVVPGSDNTLVTAGGLYSKECKLVGRETLKPRYCLRVPSQSGRFYLTCPGGGGAQHNTGIGDVGGPVSVFAFGSTKAIAVLTGVQLPASNEAWTRSDYTQDKRVLFVPSAKLIAVIPHSNDRLVLHRFDVDAPPTKGPPTKGKKPGGK